MLWSGLRGAIRTRGLASLLRRVPSALYWRYRHWVDHGRWDRRWGTDTSGVEQAYLAELAEADAAHAEHYEPVGWQTFARLVADMGVDTRSHTFVDLGSGKGRALFFASELGFPRIVGVELAERLHLLAHRNRERFGRGSGRAHGIELVHGDATRYSYPAGPLCVFMFNPFRGPVMEAVVAQLSAHVTRTGVPALIGYVNPKCAPLLDGTAGVTRLRAGAPMVGLLRSSTAYAIYRVDPVVA